MQGTGANVIDNGEGQWETIRKKGKKEGIQASNKKGKKNSMTNARTISLQASYTEHRLPDDSVAKQAEVDQIATGIESCAITQSEDKVEDSAILSMGPPEEIKHPLKTSWTFWYYKPDFSKDWEQNQMKLASFDTVEDFWAVINYIKQPSEINNGCDYSVFRTGVKPMWEDDKTKNGGKWTFNVDFVEFNRDPEILDHAWLEVLMCLIGEAFDSNGKYIMGAVLSRRHKLKKPNKIAVWTSLKNDFSIVNSIGEIILERCVPVDRYSLFRDMIFEEHVQLAKKRHESQKNYLYELRKYLS